MLTEQYFDTGKVVLHYAEGPAVLLGHSLGAHVAVQIAALAPDLTSGIVLEDTALYLIAEGRFQEHPIYHRLQTLRDFLHTERSPDEIASELASLIPAASSADRQSWAKSLNQMDPNVLASIIDNRTFIHFDPDELLPKVSCPGLLLQGNPALEGVMEDADAERVLRLVPRCTHVYFPDVGHGIHDTHPMAFYQTVSDFLESM